MKNKIVAVQLQNSIQIILDWTVFLNKSSKKRVHRDESATSSNINFNKITKLFETLAASDHVEKPTDKEWDDVITFFKDSEKELGLQDSDAQTRVMDTLNSSYQGNPYRENRGYVDMLAQYGGHLSRLIQDKDTEKAKVLFNAYFLHGHACIEGEKTVMQTGIYKVNGRLSAFIFGTIMRIYSQIDKTNMHQTFERHVLPGLPLLFGANKESVTDRHAYTQLEKLLFKDLKAAVKTFQVDVKDKLVEEFESGAKILKKAKNEGKISNAELEYLQETIFHQYLYESEKGVEYVGDYDTKLITFTTEDGLRYTLPSFIRKESDIEACLVEELNQLNIGVTLSAPEETVMQGDVWEMSVVDLVKTDFMKEMSGAALVAVLQRCMITLENPIGTPWQDSDYLAIYLKTFMRRNSENIDTFKARNEGQQVVLNLWDTIESRLQNQMFNDLSDKPDLLKKSPQKIRFLVNKNQISIEELKTLSADTLKQVFNTGFIMNGVQTNRFWIFELLLDTDVIDALGTDFVKQLLESRDATFYRPQPLYLAAVKGHENIFKVLLSRDVIDALGTDFVKGLLESRDYSQYKYQPLHLAATTGQANIFKVLLSREVIDALGTDFVKGLLESRDYSQYKYQPLHLAAAKDHESIVKVLMHSAVMEVLGKDVVKKLLESREESDCKFQSLHIAAVKGNENIFKVLLDMVATNSLNEDIKKMIWDVLKQKDYSLTSGDGYDVLHYLRKDLQEQLTQAFESGRAAIQPPDTKRPKLRESS